MSSPTTQFVYIPNLVGRQMLRIPIEDLEDEEIIAPEDILSMSNTTSQPITIKSTPSFARDSSPSPSMSSVSSLEE